MKTNIQIDVDLTAANYTLKVTHGQITHTLNLVVTDAVLDSRSDFAIYGTKNRVSSTLVPCSLLDPEGAPESLDAIKELLTKTLTGKPEEYTCHSNYLDMAFIQYNYESQQRQFAPSLTQKPN